MNFKWVLGLFLVGPVIFEGPLGHTQSSPERKAPPVFSSTYTDLEKGCRNAFRKSEIAEGGDMPSLCKGAGDYSVSIFFSAASSHMEVVKGPPGGERTFHLSLAATPLAGGSQTQKIEWRLANNRPFAVIYRNALYRNAEAAMSGLEPAVKTGDVLVVKGLDGFGNIDASIDPRKEPQANERARAAADAGYVSASQGK